MPRSGSQSTTRAEQSASIIYSGSSSNRMRSTTRKRRHFVAVAERRRVSVLAKHVCLFIADGKIEKKNGGGGEKFDRFEYLNPPRLLYSVAVEGNADRNLGFVSIKID